MYTKMIHKCDKGYCKSVTNGRDVVRFVTDCQRKYFSQAVFSTNF